MSSQKKLPCGRKIPPMISSSRSLEQFLEILERFSEVQDLNRSAARRQIVEVAFSQKNHFTAQDFAKQVQERFSKIGTATVYRNLPILVEAGILRESFSDDLQQKIYELEDGQHHDHIVCLDCGTILEFFEEPIETAQTRILKKLQFEEVRHRHVIYGRCQFRSKSS